MQQALDALRRVGEYGDIYRYKNTEQSPYTQIYEAIDAINVELAKPEQTETLRVADAIELNVALKTDRLFAAKELRRLHDENDTLKKCLFQMQNAAIELAKPEQKIIGWINGEPQYAKPEQESKLTDAGAETNIDPFTLYPKGSGMVTLNQPVAWHHPDCGGECIACLIERVVTEAYGTQGLEYLRKRVNTSHQPEQADRKTLIECIAGSISMHMTIGLYPKELLAAAEYIVDNYTAPPRKPWVSLSDAEEIELDEKYGDDFNAYIDARDAKLKELNG
ncbi:MAG: hypothetical protein ACOVKL_00125 [Polynucleobacter sp.]